MARAFLLHFLGAYLFSNGRQMVQLRWLALFQEFGEAWKANQGQTCLAYLYSTLNTLSRGTLQQLVGSWKLLEVSYLFILCIFTYSLQSCKMCYLENCHLAFVVLQTVILYLTCGLCFFLQQWVVRYGLITPGTNLVLKDFPQVRAHLVGLTSDEVSLRVPVVHASSCISFRILFF